MVEYKKGDKIRILRDMPYKRSPNGIYLKGEIHEVGGVDEENAPWFIGDADVRYGWGNSSQWFEKIEENTPETTTPPDTIEAHGRTYKLETLPPHVWKFGDWARHTKYGVGFVYFVGGTAICLVRDEPESEPGALRAFFANAEELVYLGSADIPE